ncbi:mechanosensitive ion channel domain-containing protein [uncultured Flavobacterium sp.]|uniref:mechanosensitive ion channel family protein n=1 Tax=uncultured Flavobacterium sp. TaxID=165435 RepID=UPI0030EDD075|tara:strand:- start:105512 stop:106339 length:828 start_codon:yes stop_codon:yes gene_type:complete
MEIFNQLKTDTFNSLNSLFYKIGEGFISFVYAVLILIVGWLITKFILFILSKALHVAKIDKLTDRINKAEVFGKEGIKFNISTVILSFVKWILVLVLFIIAADVMQWTIISVEISNLLRYLPKLFSAIVLFMVGLYIANYVRKAIYGMFNSFDLSGSKIISTAVFYGIVALVTITALNQANIDTTVITNNITIILGALLLTFALAFGFGSKEVIEKLLLSFYSRKNYEIGDRIKVNSIEGTIESMDNICITIITETGKTVIPIKEIVDNKVEIIK